MAQQPTNKSDFVTTTVRLDRAVSDQLRRIAFDSHTSQNYLISMAVRAFLDVQGYGFDTPSTRED